MRNNVNISFDNKTFTYLVEYTKANSFTDSQDIYWAECNKNKKCIHLFDGDVYYFRHGNNWYSTKNIDKNTTYIPKNSISTSKIRVYIPHFSINRYLKNIKFAVNVNTWINGYKIDLGSYIFKSNDALANENGLLKNGNNEYSEYVEFNIIDPFSVVYSDDWTSFRNNVCKEPLYINNTGSLIYVSMYVIDENDDVYIINDKCTCGSTMFNISDHTDFLSLELSESRDPQGLKLQFNMNSEYNSLFNYLNETYNINVDNDNINIEIVIKNKDSVILGPSLPYGAIENYGSSIQYTYLDTLKRNESIKTFFSTWDAFEEGWSFIASFNVFNEYSEECISIVSNELPITQELFSRFIYGSEKIIDIDDMNINKYNVINKIENKIVQFDRPNDNKNNMIQPIFYRVKEAEVLTIHPAVTENICINLDEYKSKVEKFILQIDDCRFDQIGANKYGILFKLYGNKLSNEIVSGTYYILNENYELVTTGKYNCVR